MEFFTNDLLDKLQLGLETGSIRVTGFPDRVSYGILDNGTAACLIVKDVDKYIVDIHPGFTQDQIDNVPFAPLSRQRAATTIEELIQLLNVIGRLIAMRVPKHEFIDVLKTHLDPKSSPKLPNNEGIVLLYLAHKIKKHVQNYGSTTDVQNSGKGNLYDDMRKLRTYVIISFNTFTRGARNWNIITDNYPNLNTEVQEILTSHNQMPNIQSTGIGMIGNGKVTLAVNETNVPYVSLGAVISYQLEFPELENFI